MNSSTPPRCVESLLSSTLDRRWCPYNCAFRLVVHYASDWQEQTARATDVGCSVYMCVSLFTRFFFVLILCACRVPPTLTPSRRRMSSSVLPRATGKHYSYGIYFPHTKNTKKIHFNHSFRRTNNCFEHCPRKVSSSQRAHTGKLF